VSDLDRLIEYLPQKKPFLFLDHVTEAVSGERASGTKTFPAGDRIFENHLPDEPLVPGVILIEALAQLCAVVLIPAEGEQPVHGYLAEVSRMRFRRLIHPDETITLHAALDRRMGTAARFDVRAQVGEEVAAEGFITVGGMRGAPESR
jgi:3-hydroxyacyl-[acyl-carrier-protein] dehydratase